MRDLFEPLVRDPATVGDVAKERDDVALALRSAEGDEQHGVVLGRGQGAILGTAGGDGRAEDGRHPAHARTSTASTAVIRRPVKNGISARTCRRASVSRRCRIRSTSSVGSAASKASSHS